MKIILLASTVIGLTSLAVLAGSCAPAQPAGRAAMSELTGRTAGAPLQCVPTRQTANLRIADRQTVVYGSGRTIWVNRLASDCLRTGPAHVLVVEPLGSQYCRGDRIHSIDPVTKIPGPFCRLGDFVPYTR